MYRLNQIKPLLAVLIGIGLAFGTYAQDTLRYSATALGNASTGHFAPYFIGSLNHGKTVRKASALADIETRVDIDRSRRFSWGAGIEVVGGFSTGNKYDRWDNNAKIWTSQENRPASVWVQQLYGEVKWRGVFLRAGQKDHHSALLDERLSSGDLTRSSNARGIPGAEVGFIDFQNIPFTNGWVQIEGVVEYGKFTDNSFAKKQYNYYNWVLATGIYYTYKRCYFRTKPSMPFSVTVGMQFGGQFGGTTEYYRQGEMYRKEVRGFRFADLFKMFLPIRGNGNNFMEGSSLGSWDLKARYRLRNSDELSFAFQWPWEDGSGIGRRNGLDGLWGVYYTSARRGLVNGAAIEWLDFRNHSGPIHWAPGDFPGTTITNEATGGDNYYNNDTYTAYTNYGMAIATPFLVSPIYNLNGYPAFLHNRAQGLHLALTGCVDIINLDWALKYSWQQAWGSGRTPQSYSLIDNSLLLEANWNAASVLDGFAVNAKLAFDAGALRGNNFGFMIGIRYAGVFNFKNKK